ncbi:MAG TPA: MFS transporter [Planctomycetota bacterium]|nr:MFS transporter [Planctomycetota bacterium]
MSESLERRVVSKVSWRLLPYLFLLYLVAYIDRINTGVAGLQMRRDVPMDDEAWGFGVGLFFPGYFLFEVPSNLILARVGARIWIARIMIFWGIVSACMMLAKTVPLFYGMRFLLGAAEAGFFPGILFYLTKWFRERDRARAVALFMTAGTLAGVLGNPLSGALLKLDGVAGLHGWQWIFLVEGIPAVLLGFSVLKFMAERPADAAWLEPEEQAWLEGELGKERALKAGGPQKSVVAALTEPKVLLLTLVYFLVVTSAYGFEMWLPVILKPLARGDDFLAAVYSAVPYVVATVAMVLIGIAADRTGQRRWTVALCAFLSAAGFFLSAKIAGPALGLAALSLAWIGIKSAQGPFWALSASTLSPAAAAAGLAFINSVANLGGQVGPWLVGRLQKQTHSFSTGLLASSVLLLAAGLIVPTIRARPGRPGGSIT